MNDVAIKTISDLLHSVNDLADPIDEILESCLGSVKRVLEAIMEAERDDFCGISYCKRGAERMDSRNGYYERDLETCFGLLEKLRVPRTRCGGFRSSLIRHYERRQRRLTEFIRSMFLCGISQRDISEVLRPFLGIEPSASTVSRIAKSLDTEVRQFQLRPIEDDYKYLLLDGIALKVKVAPYAVGRCALVAMGVREDGSKELLSFRVEHSESTACWERFLSDLFNRGLIGSNLKLIVSDGGPGLLAALGYVYPYIAHQRCFVHKMRNVASKLKKAHKKPCLDGLKLVFEAKNKSQAETSYRRWEREWTEIAPDAVECVRVDLEELLVFLSFPKADRRLISTTNHLERCFREFRRRLRTIGCMKNTASCERMLYSICKRLNQRWRSKTASFTFTQAA
jgi:putative transposase